MPKALNKKSIKPFRLNKKYFSIDKNMPDYSKDPVFMAKHEKAEKFIAEHGLPESFKRKPKAKGVKH